MKLPSVIAGGPDQISVQEILPDVWMLGGYISDNFFCDAPSSNVYILRDGDVVYLIDPGGSAAYRPKILEVVERYKRHGVTKLHLLITQGHFDHSRNDDIVRSTDLEWEFFLPEAEMPTMDSVADFMRDLDELSRYEDVFQTMFVRTTIGPVIGGVARVSPAAARTMLRLGVTATMGAGDHMAGSATPLTEEQKVTRTYGSVTLSGWEIGRFFVIHDGSHSPGHICVYDPRHKLILTGDTTVEVNPAFGYSSMNKLVDITGSLATMAREGAIEYAADGHRSARYFTELLRRVEIAPLDDTQLIDFARGSEQCAAFLTFFETYYREMITEVRAAHARAGRATVGQIVDELYRSTNKYMRLKLAMALPRIPSRLDVLVIQVLKESGAMPIKTGDRIVFDPVSFDPVGFDPAV